MSRATPKSPITALLVSFGGTVMLVVALVLNMGSVLPVEELERRCVAAYRAGDYPQFGKPGYSFVFHGKGPRIYDANAAKMRVTDTLNLGVRPDAETRVTLTCRTRPGQKVSLHRWDSR